MLDFARVDLVLDVFIFWTFDEEFFGTPFRRVAVDIMSVGRCWVVVRVGVMVCRKSD